MIGFDFRLFDICKSNSTEITNRECKDREHTQREPIERAMQKKRYK